VLAAQIAYARTLKLLSHTLRLHQDAYTSTLACWNQPTRRGPYEGRRTFSSMGPRLILVPLA